MRKTARPEVPGWYLLGIAAVAASAVSLAALIVVHDSEAQTRIAAALRADINTEYELFCERFLRSDPPDQRARCVAALWDLRTWEEERRALDAPEAF
jgi:hypothetical protein